MQGQEGAQASAPHMPLQCTDCSGIVSAGMQADLHIARALVFAAARVTSCCTRAQSTGSALESRDPESSSPQVSDEQMF